MNSGRLTSNQTKFKSISGPAIDIFSYPPLYKFVHRRIFTAIFVIPNYIKAKTFVSFDRL